MMFLNTRPRSVSNHIRTVLNPYREMYSNAEIVAMSGNESNDWTAPFFGIAAGPVHEYRGQQLQTFGNGQDLSYSFRSHLYDEPRFAQSWHHRMAFLPPSITFEPLNMMSKKQKGSERHATLPSTIPRSYDYSEWECEKKQNRDGISTTEEMINRQLDFPATTFTQISPEEYDSTGIGSSKSGSFASSATELSPCDLWGYTTAQDSPNGGESSPRSAFSSQSNFGMTLHDSASSSLTSHGIQEEPSGTPWWPELGQDAIFADPLTTSVPFCSWDGIMDDSEFSPWISDSETNPSASQALRPVRTIAPEALSLRVPTLLSMNTINESRGSGIESKDDGRPGMQSLRDNSQEHSRMGASAAKTAIAKPRHKLPDRAQVAILPKTSSWEAREERSQTSIPRSIPLRHSKSTSRSVVGPNHSTSSGGRTSHFRVPKRIEPKPNSNDVMSSQQQCSEMMFERSQQRQNRAAKDEFLVRSKQAGMSYKDIKRQGKFTEPESTLRGRYRTLTKDKRDRVRKPEWDENDNRLLERAIRKLSQGTETPKAKIPWKQVADYIFDHGGSYHFGNATCRKHWDELQTNTRR